MTKSETIQFLKIVTENKNNVAFCKGEAISVFKPSDERLNVWLNVDDEDFDSEIPCFTFDLDHYGVCQFFDEFNKADFTIKKVISEDVDWEEEFLKTMEELEEIERITEPLYLEERKKVRINLSGNVDYEEMCIAELELSVRATNCLEGNGISYVGQLIKYTADDLMEFKHFGWTALKEVRHKLKEIGLNLKDDQEVWNDG